MFLKYLLGSEENLKITHVCLCGPVTDGWTYQDNLLPKFHKKLGYEVSVITSQYIYNNNGELDKDKRRVYLNEYGIKTIRLKSKLFSSVNSKFKRFEGVYEALKKENPDILFIHGVQFLDIKEIVKYLKSNSKVKVFIDNHADFTNSATNWLSKNLLHKIIWKKVAHLIEPFTYKFYGVLPARVDFLHEVYKLPINKIELLLMGADDEKVKEARKKSIRDEIRIQYNIKNGDFLIISGGKIDQAKRQILHLMESVKQIDKENVKLIVFGSVIEALEKELKYLADGEKIQYIGWIDSDKCYKLFAAADLGVFPGRHSVLWEQAIGTGLPCIFKYWSGTTHVDVGGNCEFLYEGSIDEIKSKLSSIIDNKTLYLKMKDVAENKGMSKFSYYGIAEKSIE